MKTLITAIFISTFALAANAQKGQKIKSMQIAMLTNALNLDEASAIKFWPVFNAFTDARKAIRQEKKSYQDDLDNNANLSEADIMKNINGITNCNQREVDLQKKYNVEFLKVISAKQLAALYNAEKNFKELLLERAKGVNNSGNGEGQGRRKFGWNK
jgi:hypothetical protein